MEMSKMEFEHDRTGLVTGVLISYLISISTAVAMSPINFSSFSGEKTWRASGNPIRCGLSLSIPNYGIGYFEQYATEPPHFILRKWDTVSHSLPAKIVVRSPLWKPAGTNAFVGSVMINPGAYGIFLRRDSTLKVLTYLSQGLETTFNYQSDLGFNVIVALTPIGFQKEYSLYQQCIGNDVVK